MLLCAANLPRRRGAVPRGNGFLRRGRMRPRLLQRANADQSAGNEVPPSAVTGRLRKVEYLPRCIHRRSAGGHASLTSGIYAQYAEQGDCIRGLRQRSVSSQPFGRRPHFSISEGGSVFELPPHRRHDERAEHVASSQSPRGSPPRPPEALRGVRSELHPQWLRQRLRR